MILSKESLQVNFFFIFFPTSHSDMIVRDGECSLLAQAPQTAQVHGPDHEHDLRGDDQPVGGQAGGGGCDQGSKNKDSLQHPEAEGQTQHSPGHQQTAADGELQHEEGSDGHGGVAEESSEDGARVREEILEQEET